MQSLNYLASVYISVVVLTQEVSTTQNPTQENILKPQYYYAITDTDKCKRDTASSLSSFRVQLLKTVRFGKDQSSCCFILSWPFLFLSTDSVPKDVFFVSSHIRKRSDELQIKIRIRENTLIKKYDEIQEHVRMLQYCCHWRSF